MKVKVVGKDVHVSSASVEQMEKKLAFLDKYILIDDDTTATAVVKKHGNDIKLEITIPTRVGYLRSEVVDHDLRNAIDESADRLESQIRKQKTRLSRRHKEGLAQNFLNEATAADEKEETPVRVKRIAVDTLDVEEAIMQMELLGHSFFLYRDSSSGVISAVYKREQGGYGVIEAV
jgi:putative sigma-54 modulation protein